MVAINGIFIPLTGFMVAYPFARRNFKGKKVMFSVMMATVMLPGAVVMVPTYIMFKSFGLVDNLASQWVGAFWGGGAMNIFLMIQFSARDSQGVRQRRADRRGQYVFDFYLHIVAHV